MEVIEWPRVEVIRSCSWPISSARVGWYPTAEGIRPSSVDTSDPAWVNRKMLSMNSRTSWPCTARKSSAMVSADSATRSRVPGGSSIWPNTSAVSAMTPDSVISRNRSLPSRVRSPTPAKTETPPKFWATRRIISWISTVLPTPAPPNSPIFPPSTYGVSRSMTLMPVTNIWVRGSSWSSAGGSRWIGQRSVMSSDEGVAEDVEHVPLGHVADRYRDRRAGVGHLGAPDQAVGGLHGDRAHDVVADVLLDLERQRPGLVLQHDVHVQREVDLRQVLGRELDVHDGAGDPGDPPGARGALVAGL